MELAEIVRSTAQKIGISVEIVHLSDPRVEAEDHYYNAKHSKLIELGLQPHVLSEAMLDSLLQVAMRYRDRVDGALILPRVNWRHSRNNRVPVVLPSEAKVPCASPNLIPCGADRAAFQLEVVRRSNNNPINQ